MGFSEHDIRSTRVLISGAAGGMGQGIAKSLADAGHTVLLADINGQGALELAENLTSEGSNSHAFTVDVTSEDSVRALHEEVTQRFSSIDVLINAAGVLDRKYLTNHSATSFEAVVDINLNGPFRLIRYFSPLMVEQKWGRIINISSIAGRTGYPYPSYAASKAGLSNLSRSLMIDLWGSGVTINSISPGVVNTGMPIQSVRDRVDSKVPTRGIVEPAEIAHAIQFLMSDLSANINGLDLVIDGGATNIFQFIDGPPQSHGENN